MTCRFSHRAMGTLFEMWLCGDDQAHLQSVAFQAWEEVDRLELLMSRYDSRAEIARINREAAERPVRVEVELFNILQDCQEWAMRTQGYFNIAYASENHDSPGNMASPPYILNEGQRTVHFSHEGVSLDLGGYGKGYTLDRIVDILCNFSILSACVHGGQSSVFALGSQENEKPWVVDIPHHKDPTKIVLSRPLFNEGFSYSSALSEGDGDSDIVDPSQNRTIQEAAACWVSSPSALEAEVWTTALLAMGRTRVEETFRDVTHGVPEMGWV